MVGDMVILELVSDIHKKPVQDEYKPILESIKNSAWKNVQFDQDKTIEEKSYWLAAAILAGYKLGRDGAPKSADNLRNLLPI